MPHDAESSRPDRDPPATPRHRPLFSPAATTLFRVVLVGAALFATGLGVSVYGYYHSSYWNSIGIAPTQPVLFSHRHPAGELRIDCRNCHAGVESSAFAGMPSTQTCLTCHSQIFTHTEMLRPVVESAESGIPLHWNRVTRLPDHVYFNHSIHVAKGVGCTSCHGDIGRMALTSKAQPMSMRWCLDCHKDPAPHLREASKIFASDVPTPRADAARLMAAYQIHPEHLTDCAICHH